MQSQHSALKSSQSFFSSNDMDDDDDSSPSDDETDAFEFFLRLFVKDEKLREYYERNSEKGEFVCLVCGGVGEKVNKKYGDCVGLVQHSNAIARTKRRAAHRAFGRAVCRVLGWDIERLPSIVLDVGDSLGEKVAKAGKSKEDTQKEDGIIKETTSIPHTDVEKDSASGDLMESPEADEELELLYKGVGDDKEEGLPAVCENLDDSKNGKNSKDDNDILITETALPCKPSAYLKLDVVGSSDLTPMPPGEQPILPLTLDPQAKTAAVQLQQNGLNECKNFFSKTIDLEDEQEIYEFLLRLFLHDNDLRDYYEKNFQKGRFYCLVCGDIGTKKVKVFKNCFTLVKHSRSMSKTKRQAAHRALGRSVCKVLNWDINRFPSIAHNVEDPLGQSSTKAAKLQDNTSNDGNAD